MGKLSVKLFRKPGPLKRLKANYSFIRKIAKSKSTKALKKLIKMATKSQIFSIAEIVYNLLHQNIKISANLKKKLSPYGKKLRKFACKSSNCGLKRKILTSQKGGILPILAPIIAAAIPAITSLITTFAGKKKD
jgi:hypothetical protein